MNLLNEFKQEKLTNTISIYEIFYQLSLAKIISITNTKEVSSNIDLSSSISSLYEMFFELENLKGSFNLEEEIKKQAAMDTLEKFGNENLELVKLKKIDIDSLVNDINDNNFYNKSMLEIYTNKKDEHKLYWQSIISKELSDEIINSINNMK